MPDRVRMSGNPLQPMLVTLPFGLFVCATSFDVAALTGGPRLFGEVGYWTMVAGLAAVALTLGVGLIDLWDEPPGRVRSLLLRFNVIGLAMGGVFLLACLVRNSGAAPLAAAPLLVVEAVGLGVGALGLRYGTALLRQVAETSAQQERSATLDALARRPAQRPG
ncbi:DUF2231 domain-containing protein [Solwaraspora sp. WMMB335]|uniref:DUF2231 domain-containing protein n=1 Tax=Solwaraspora sp. WMMB335 TaxID=3404118 RepID=UPI003B922AF6